MSMNYQKYAASVIVTGLCSLQLCYSQNLSPYSYFGIGSFNNVDNSRNIALGNTGIALESPNYLNAKNPAAIATISEKNVVFDVNGLFKYNSISGSGETDKRFNANFTNLGVGFGVSKNFAFSVHVQPSTTTDYKIASPIPVEGTYTEYPVTYEGSGGVSNAGIDAGYRITNNWVVGANVKNYFGSVDRNEIITLNSDVYQLEVSKDIRYTGFGYSMGTQFSHYFEKSRLQMTLGGVVNFKTRLKAKGEIAYTKDLDYTNSTITEISTKNTAMPFGVGVGFNFLYRDRYRVTFDYTNSQWSKVDRNGVTGIDYYYDQNVYGLGFELLPFNRNTDQLKSSIVYRFGVNYDTGFYKVRNIKIDKFEATAGLGFPLKRNLFINLNYAYGIQGLHSGTSVRENYHLLNISFNFLELWFIKNTIN